MAQPPLKDLNDISPSIASVDDAISVIESTLQPLHKCCTPDGISNVSMLTVLESYDN